MADDPTPQELRLNMEAVKEDVATLSLKLDKNNRILYGDEDIHLLPLLDRLEAIEQAVKTLVETDKKRVWVIRGIVVGVGLQFLDIQLSDISAILLKVFS